MSKSELIELIEADLRQLKIKLGINTPNDYRKVAGDWCDNGYNLFTHFCKDTKVDEPVKWTKKIMPNFNKDFVYYQTLKQLQYLLKSDILTK